MDNPKLVSVKMELRFATERGHIQCAVAASEYLASIGIHGKYLITDFKIDQNDQDARVLTILLGV